MQSLKEIVDLCKPEIVFHLAAQPLVRCSYIDPLGTWSTNVLGSLNLLEALKPLNHRCVVVMITTDKVTNREWDYGYERTIVRGGSYSASKARQSWRLQVGDLLAVQVITKHQI